jgi:ferrochelatase
MKHSPPWIADAVEQMRADGIQRAVGIVMAPHWAGLSIPTYAARVPAEAGIRFTFVESFHDQPAFIGMLAERVRAAFAELPPEARDDATLIVSAHSLPVRDLPDGTQRCLRCDAASCAERCRYQAELQRTADLVAAAAGVKAYRTGWQSAGRTADPWWGPPIEDVILEQAKDGRKAVVVCSAGFVSDHLEILYDLDIEARELANSAGMAFARTEMPNADPVFTGMLADVVRDHLAASA